nr:MAG: nonstructural protein [Microviridae sp.]
MELFKKEDKVKKYKGLYSVYDTATELYAPPVAFQNDSEAIRALSQYVNTPGGDTPLHKFTEQFTLVQVGWWDERKGFVEDEPGNKIVKNIGELKEEKK